MYLLRYTSPADGSHWHFCNLGLQWPNRPACRMIEMTRQNPLAAEVRVFATEQEAEDVLVIAGSPARRGEDRASGWEIIESP